MIKNNTIIKTALALTMFSSTVFANTANSAIKENSSKLLSETFNQKINVIETHKVKGFNGLNIVVIEDEKTKQQMPIFSNDEGSILIPFSTNIIAKDINSLGLEEILKKVVEHNTPLVDKLKNEAANKTVLEKEEMDKMIMAVLKETPTLTKQLTTGKSKNVTILLDPLCGYCKEKVQSSFEEFKDYNVNLVFVGMLHRDSVRKSSTLYEKWDDKMSFEEKIKLLQKYFDGKKLSDSELAKSNKKEVEIFTQKLGTLQLGEKFNNKKFAGNYGVPYIIKN